MALTRWIHGQLVNISLTTSTKLVVAQAELLNNSNLPLIPDRHNAHSSTLSHNKSEYEKHMIDE